MRGSMRQRSEGSWELRIFTGVDPLTGRRRYVTKTFRGGRRAAEKELAALVSSKETAAPIASVTVGEVLERWFEHARGALSPATVATTRRILDAHLVPHVGALPQCDVNLGLLHDTERRVATGRLVLDIQPSEDVSDPQRQVRRAGT